jgi:transposase
VTNQGYSIIRASKKLDIKFDTAAGILRKYKQKGVVYDRASRHYTAPDLLAQEEKPMTPREENSPSMEVNATSILNAKSEGELQNEKE